MSTSERYNEPWYSKRVKNNRIIVNFLIEKIFEHREKDFPWTREDLRYLKYEDLLEIAVAAANKKTHILLGANRDFSNNADSKFSIVRINGKENKSYSALITGCEKKEHILACVFEEHLEKFYFFSFPARLKQHTIPFDPNTYEPKTDNYMWEYERTTFESMARSVQ